MDRARALQVARIVLAGDEKKWKITALEKVRAYNIIADIHVDCTTEDATQTGSDGEQVDESGSGQ